MLCAWGKGSLVCGTIPMKQLGISVEIWLFQCPENNMLSGYKDSNFTCSVYDLVLSYMFGSSHLAQKMFNAHGNTSRLNSIAILLHNCPDV